MSNSNLKFVWCTDCLRKKPPVDTSSSKMIPLRSAHYELMPDGFSIDDRMVGICESCLEKRQDFHKKNAKPIDYDDKRLIRKFR